MGEFSVEEYYRKIVQNEKSSAIASLKTLEHFVVQDNSTTLQEFDKKFRQAFKILKDFDPKLEVESVGEIYFHFITLDCAGDQVKNSPFSMIFVFIIIFSFCFQDMNAFKIRAIKQSKIFFDKINNSREKLAKNARKFITDGCKILVHSYSGAVLESLKSARSMNKHLEVYVTESAPDYGGRKMVDALRAADISATLILDSAVGYIMERVRIVLVGAEGVVESGGIINKVSSSIIFSPFVRTFFFLYS